ncbi:hypothetical protein GNP94_14685 [Paenibacillus campinasensis]|uniref:Uncharacterized protein n=1 Tax=Paenibacillus campinasensis TaxID=66347 RepID=A0ABW9T1Q9_9BACL|nr:hypothetical protein [Paenibacillus campinasensis]MUG67233.1 hypothetical protein [Paenibacillus campinasensis]
MRSVDRVMQEGIVHLSLGAKRGCTLDRACGKVRESPPVAVKIGKHGTNVRRGSFPIIKANALLLRRFAPLYREAMCSRMRASRGSAKHQARHVAQRQEAGRIIRLRTGLDQRPETEVIFFEFCYSYFNRA